MAEGSGGRPALTRELIAARFREPVPDVARPPQELSESEVAESLRATLHHHRERTLWLFAYGSLMWNPELDWSEQRVAAVHGYHRRFCLWQRHYRATPDTPGLMLALDAGGSCRGVVYRVDAPDVAQKVAAVWQREMQGDGYRPRWVTARTGEGPVPAVTFVVNRHGERYAGRLAESVVARHIASACGHRGPCAEYLWHTVTTLERLGIREARLWRLQQLVADALRIDGGQRCPPGKGMSRS